MKKKILLSLSALLLCLVMLSSCAFYGTGNNLQSGSNIGQDAPTSSLISSLLEQYSYYNFGLTDEELCRAVVNAYIEKTGDVYAYYYNEEEFNELTAENSGESQGIGITIIENTEFHCIEIISVLPNTPAMRAGLKNGDLIVQLGIGEKAEKVSDFGFEIALTKLKGGVGEACEFGIVRDGDFDNIIEFSIIREEFTSTSVLHSVSVSDASVGIIKILNFDLTTPPQFKDAMEDLIASGCTSFVYDLRDNPGGDLASVSAILSLFLNSGDTVVITEDRSGYTETLTCKPVKYDAEDAYSTCNVTEEDIGKYRDYPVAVIINNNSASASELFTGSFKSYGLATIVGETSYGKGCMQSIIPLSNFNSDFKGALKLTTKYYRPYGMKNYHGIGITPTEGYEVELSEEAKAYNPYELLNPENQSVDNQLAKAIEAVKSNAK